MKKFYLVAICVMACLLIGCEPKEIPSVDDKDQTYVDLGLSVNWATCNIGAKLPKEVGDYFAWGEVVSKETYNWSNYLWCNDNPNKLTKYCTYSDYGRIDTTLVLRAEDDAATVNWGSKWRMPTNKEMQELINNCNWDIDTLWQNDSVIDILYYAITAKDKLYTDTLFLPLAGVVTESTVAHTNSFGLYWSSSLHESSPRNAYGLRNDAVQSGERCFGRTIRPVMDK